MSIVKPTASLSGGLLARKGAAAPAGFNAAIPSPSQAIERSLLERLNVERPTPYWAGEARAAEPVPLPRSREETPADAARSAPPRDVGFGKTVAAQAVPRAGAPVRRAPPQAVAHSEKPAEPKGPSDEASFKVSLRLDTERHRKLRLASVHLGRSGQQILLDALDAYLGGAIDATLGDDCACLRACKGE